MGSTHIVHLPVENHPAAIRLVVLGDCRKSNEKAKPVSQSKLISIRVYLSQ